MGSVYIKTCWKRTKPMFAPRNRTRKYICSRDTWEKIYKYTYIYEELGCSPTSLLLNLVAPWFYFTIEVQGAADDLWVLCRGEGSFNRFKPSGKEMDSLSFTIRFYLLFPRSSLLLDGLKMLVFVVYEAIIVSPSDYLFVTWSLDEPKGRGFAVFLSCWIVVWKRTVF